MWKLVGAFTIVWFIGLHANRSLGAELGDFNSWMHKYLQTHAIPGAAIAVVDSDGVVQLSTFGLADREARIKFSADTLFRISSNSKIFTTLAVLRLVDLGILNLDTPIETYLGQEPWFKPMTLDPRDREWVREITLRHLLSHSSGLQKGTATNSWMDVSVHVTGSYPSSARIKENFKNVLLRHKPGVSLGYSNVAFFLASHLVAKYGGAPGDTDDEKFQNFVRNEILHPIGLTQTAYDVPLSRQRALSQAYSPLWEGGRVRPPRIFEPRGSSGDAGIATTIGNLAQFARWHLDQSRGFPKSNSLFRKRQLLFDMYRLQARESGATALGYNLGFWWKKIGGRWAVGHDGHFIGNRSAFFIDPLNDLGIVVMANAYDVNCNEIIEKILDLMPRARARASGRTLDANLRLVIEKSIQDMEDPVAAFAPETPVPRATRLDAKRSAAFAGTYRSCSFGEIEIVQSEIGIAKRWKDQTYPLIPIGPNRFQLASVSQKVFSLDKEIYEFEVNRAGKVVALWESGLSYKYHRLELSADCQSESGSE